MTWIQTHNSSDPSLKSFARLSAALSCVYARFCSREFSGMCMHI